MVLMVGVGMGVDGGVLKEVKYNSFPLWTMSSIVK